MACHAPKLCHDVTERKSIQFPRQDLDKNRNASAKKNLSTCHVLQTLFSWLALFRLWWRVILQQLLRTCRLTAVQATGTQHPTEHAGALHGDRLLTLESLNTIQMHLQQNGATRRVELPSNKVSLKKLFHWASTCYIYWHLSGYWQMSLLTASCSQGWLVQSPWRVLKMCIISECQRSPKWSPSINAFRCRNMFCQKIHVRCLPCLSQVGMTTALNNCSQSSGMDLFEGP